jgi:tripartite-type tricarboxylate transporter receptor subunit TctC
VRLLNQPDVEISASTPEQFSKFIRDEIVRWGKAVKASEAKPD